MNDEKNVKNQGGDLKLSLPVCSLTVSCLVAKISSVPNINS